MRARFNITNHQPINGPRQKKSSQLIDNYLIDEVDTKLVAAKNVVSSLEDTTKMKMKSLNDQTKNVEYWTERFPHRTRDELIEYGESIWKASI